VGQTAPLPESLAALTDLSLDVTGTFVLHATDEYFAPKEALVRPGDPEWRADAYTERGKWMDGWESQRRRTPGHDAVILRLGTPGAVSGVLCDTTHFKGNAPQEVSLEALELPATSTAEELLALPVVATKEDRAALGGRAWREILPRTAVQPDHRNVLMLPTPSPRATHVRLRIFPDGGVSRLRVFGAVVPEPGTFWAPGSVDLAAIENGGTVPAVSDTFFGPASNLLLPGRGTNMGDGWETKRRRTPGTDWCVIALGRRGIVEQLHLDTHFFKGNAPQSARVEFLDATGMDTAALRARLTAADGWDVLVDTTPVVQHRRHVLVPPVSRPATHLRVHIAPHGGVNRLRVLGHALDAPGEAAALAAFHALAPAERATVLRSFCGSAAYADRVTATLPATSVRALFAASDAAYASLAEVDLLEAFAAHPRLGQGKPAASATAASAAWSKNEQAGIANADAAILERLRERNDAYFARFGFVFLAFASGRGAGEILSLLDERLPRTRAEEIAQAAREQARITRARVGAWLLSHGAE
jgi:allantoicase